MTIGSLTVNPGAPDSYSVRLEKGSSFRIGRKSPVAGEGKLVLPSAEVSAQHAEITHMPYGLIIRDTGSTNGTQLNGEWLIPGREYILRNGDRLTIGPFNLLVELTQEGGGTGLDADMETTRLRIDVVNATILVADLKGFTGLMEAYAQDPGTVMQAVQQVFQYLREEIRTNQGQLDKIAGDAIMAYWHADPSAPNEHALKACQSALQLRSVIKTIARDRNYWPFPDFPLQLDMAIASGPVASGTLLYDEANQAVLGDTANLAFHLEKLIGEDNSGDVVVESRAYDLSKDSFSYESLGQFNIKGRQQPVTVYRLVDYLRNR